jgi:hypothetical protein
VIYVRTWKTDLCVKEWSGFRSLRKLKLLIRFVDRWPTASSGGLPAYSHLWTFADWIHRKAVISAWPLFKTAITGCPPCRKISIKHPSTFHFKQQELPGEPERGIHCKLNPQKTE